LHLKYGLHNSLDDILLGSSNQKGWHVARMRQMRNAHKILIGNLKGKSNLGDLDVNGRIILEWILKKI
jgi:hypothetical protein